MTWYAHSPSDENPDQWQTLEDHLYAVADLAQHFACQFGFGQWGRVLGLLHDIGKADEVFQRHLKGDPMTVDHSIAGACIVVDLYSSRLTGKMGGRLLAECIAGHHGGIPNWTVMVNKGERTPLERRLIKADVEWAQAVLEELDLPIIPAQEMEELLSLSRLQEIQEKFAGSKPQEYLAFSMSVLCRMLFSCLVDADYLDTERFMSPSICAIRAKRSGKPLSELSSDLGAYLDRLIEDAPNSPVNTARASVLADCRAAARCKPGIFTFTAPTGSGKTLSVLAFAFDHACTYGHKRVILAIPFTSIVEQNAQVYRSVLGEDFVLEHHSNYDFSIESEKGLSKKLASQNWDVPVVVTTNVQLLESLFSNRPSKCRKLHNIANSVIVLDEAQALPDDLMLPTLAMLEELCFDYGCTVVLCTATQPALDGLWPFESDPTEIVTHRDGFERAFGERVAFQYEASIPEKELVDRLVDERQVLCIVGTKAKARRLFEEVKEATETEGCGESVFHLSANMTPLHRTAVLNVIYKKLAEGSPCTVVSTQLVEAGVDVDFPTVYRELAGIDSLYQAAGRCNREGLRDRGIVHVFELAEDNEGEVPKAEHSWLGRMKALSRLLIRSNGDVISDDLIEPFFKWRYGAGDQNMSAILDSKGIFKHLASRDVLESQLKALRLETIAHDYRIIEDESIPVFIPWGEEGVALLNDLERAVEYGQNPAAWAMKLQRSSVAVRKDLYEKLEREGAIDKSTYEPISILLLDCNCCTYYSNDVGLLSPGEEILNELIY